MSLKNLDEEISQQVPGPGAYQPPSNYGKRIVGKNGVFGSTERRFVQMENLKTPGPGQYTNTEVKMGQSTSSTDLKKPTSMFVSRTNRHTSALSRNTKTQASDTSLKSKKQNAKSTTEIVQYDVDHNTIKA